MFQPRFVKLPAIAVAAALLGLVACGGDAPDGAGSQQVVNIGFSGPLSGGAAFYGRNTLDGLTMAVEEINSAGGLDLGDRQVRLNVVALDDRYLPSETGTNVRRLLQQSNTPVIMIPHSGGIQAAQAMNTRDPKFLLSAYSSEPRILENDNPLTMMIPPRYDGYAPPFVRETMSRYGTRLGMIPTTTAYGTQWTEVVSAEWRRQGGQVVGNRGVDYNTTTDFSSAVTLALADNPDVLFVGGPSQPTALVIRAAREQGFDGGFIVMDQAKFEEMEEIVPRQMLEGSVGIHPAATYPWEGTPAWVAKFHARFGAGRTPVSEVALNYQGMRIVARAMEIAGTASDPEAIRAALPQAAEQFPRSEAPYPVGTVTERGHLEAPVIAARIEGGRYIPLPIPPVE